ncbi:hypothetical protein QA633_40175 [Bradyrhizobium barranii]|uniref:hypothetical protein n=1 Tax=Bradyrhizobium barranii TaxID=2992140 RepID=UPI0024AFF56A|nr:hypothetical protein [Bradyrhizobium barranii]WFT94409.1 hypothetical protein QA633_40175 [Bradyrhizobium barranii]
MAVLRDLRKAVDAVKVAAGLELAAAERAESDRVSEEILGVLRLTRAHQVEPNDLARGLDDVLGLESKELVLGRNGLGRQLGSRRCDRKPCRGGRAQPSAGNPACLGGETPRPELIAKAMHS